MKNLTTILLIAFANILFAQDGNLDSTFNNNGKVITPISGYRAMANAIAVQSDGKIVMAGVGRDQANRDIVVIRYLPDGSLDLDYGVGGQFVHDISDLTDNVFDIKIDAADNAYMVGYTCVEGNICRALVIKLNRFGEFDASFGQNGIWISEASPNWEVFRSIELQADGKILIAGRGENENVMPGSMIKRLTTDGILDTSFGMNGTAFVSFDRGYDPQFMVLNSQDQIITGGYEISMPNTFTKRDIVVFKHHNNGVLDTSFGDNGIVIDSFVLQELVSSAVIQEDDKLIIGFTSLESPVSSFSLLRLNDNGIVDESFGDGGKVTTIFSTVTTATSVLLQADGKIVLSGYLGGLGGNLQYAIARYDTFGNLDNTFGVNGMVITAFDVSSFCLTAVLQPDNKLLCAGGAIDSDNNNMLSFSVARYLNEIVTSSTHIENELSTIEIFPNPNNGQFNIKFELNKSAQVTIHLLDYTGKYLQSVVNKELLSEGVNSVVVNANNQLVSGLYLLRIESPTGILYKKVVVE